MRALVALLLVAHGLVHAIMFGLSFSDQAVSDMGFDPGRSWLLGPARALGAALGAVVAILFVIAGVAYLADASWWPGVAVAAATLSLVLLALFHSRYWLVGYPISAAVLVLAGQALAE